VALLNRRDEHHDWAVREADGVEQPFRTCEAVLTEAHFLLSRTTNGSRQLARLVEKGVVEVSFSYADHSREVHRLMAAYQDVPMSFADACLVRMVAVHPDGRVYTTDHHFRIYRAHGNRHIETVMP
jgi:predicted nucleic acid-binding protein